MLAAPARALVCCLIRQEGVLITAYAQHSPANTRLDPRTGTSTLSWSSSGLRVNGKVNASADPGPPGRFLDDKRDAAPRCNLEPSFALGWLSGAPQRGAALSAVASGSRTGVCCFVAMTDYWGLVRATTRPR